MTADTTGGRGPAARVRADVPRSGASAPRLRLACAAAGLAAVTLAACSTAPGTSAYAPATSAATAAVSAPLPSSTAHPAPAAAPGAQALTISGFTFSTLTVKAGATVTVVNSDSVPHTVNVNGAGIDVHVPAHGSAPLTAPGKAGIYPLTCDLHPAMHGTLTVT